MALNVMGQSSIHDKKYYHPVINVQYAHDTKFCREVNDEPTDLSCQTIIDRSIMISLLLSLNGKPGPALIFIHTAK